MNARRWALAALGTIALLGAGCSSEPSETDGGSSAAGDQAVRFAQCMRENGVPDFPDPDASGELSIDGVLNGSSLDASSPAWEAAMRACKDLQPAGFEGDTQRNPEEQSRALEFADCMRANGVEDFPDPVDGEPLVNTYNIPSSNRPGGMDALNAAMQQCRELGPTGGER